MPSSGSGSGSGSSGLLDLSLWSESRVEQSIWSLSKSVDLQQ